MRCARIKADGAGYYHVMSRAIERRFIFDRRGKEKFHEIMRKLEAFCGVRIITYTILDSHWHILLEVPVHRAITDEELIRRIEILYDTPTARMIHLQLQELREADNNETAERLKAGFTYRMYDLSEFCKTLKQRFSMYYNRKHDREGTLWNQRFKSILVERSRNALLTMAAYIDLNAVRAGIVKDPKDYRWCGYGEAVAAKGEARDGLIYVMQALGNDTDWSKVSAEYRKYIYQEGEQKGIGPEGEPLRPGFQAQQVKQVLVTGGRLSRNEILRCRVRYFSDGLVLGSQAFVEEQFLRYRDQFGIKRKNGARAMKYAEWNGLSTMRNLQKAVIFVPTVA